MLEQAISEHREPAKKVHWDVVAHQIYVGQEVMLELKDQIIKDGVKDFSVLHLIVNLGNS